jgi:hypothetical protein
VSVWVTVGLGDGDVEVGDGELLGDPVPCEGNGLEVGLAVAEWTQLGEADGDRLPVLLIGPLLPLTLPALPDECGPLPGPPL